MQVLQQDTGTVVSVITRPAETRLGGRWNDFAINNQANLWLIGGEDADAKGTVEVLDPDHQAAPAVAP